MRSTWYYLPYLPSIYNKVFLFLQSTSCMVTMITNSTTLLAFFVQVQTAS